MEVIEDCRISYVKSRMPMIATPVARNPSWKYTFALVNTVALFKDLGMAYGIQFVVGSSNIPKARNELVARFLASPCTDMIFIDDDMEWNEQSVIRLLASPQLVTAGDYRKKVDKPNSDPDVWCGVAKVGPENAIFQDDMNFVQYLRVGTGFLKINRAVFERLIEAHPDRKAPGPKEAAQEVRDNYHRFFRFGDDENETGEDYFFCDSWTDIGGEIWVDPEMVLGHVGEKVFRGS